MSIDACNIGDVTKCHVASIVDASARPGTSNAERPEGVRTCTVEGGKSSSAH